MRALPRHSLAAADRFTGVSCVLRAKEKPQHKQGFYAKYVLEGLGHHYALLCSFGIEMQFSKKLSNARMCPS